MLFPLTLLPPAIVIGADGAAAAPAAGYTATLIPTGEEAYSVAVDSVTHTVYLADPGTDEVSVVDGATNAVTTPIPLTGSPRGVAVDPVTNTVYVALTLSSATSTPAVAVIDGTTGTVTDTIPLPAGSAPYGVAVDNSTDTAYVAEEGAAAVAVINGSTDKVTNTVSTSTSRPYALAVDETTDVVWVGATGGNVLAISGTKDTVTQTISLGTSLMTGVTVNPATDIVYATTVSSGRLAVIDGDTSMVSSIIALTEPPDGVAVDPGSGTVFASSFSGLTGSGTTWVIDAASNAITDTIQRGGNQVAVDTATGSAYEAAYAAQQNAAWELTPSAANAMSPVIKSTSATFDTGASNSFAIAGSALPAATYSETGQLPSGVTFSPSGVLSGSPAVSAVGSYPITITAANGIAPDYSQAFTLTVVELPSITVPSGATFKAGTAGTIPLEVTGNPPVTGVGLYANIPSWMSLTQTGSGSWELTGTPPAGSGGVYDPVLYATSSAGSTNSTVPVTVLETPSITSAAATTFLADSNNQYDLSARGYPAPTFAASGLPPGAYLFSNGQLVSEPELEINTVGTHHFTITATNSVGTGSQDFTLTVRSPLAVGVEGSDGRLWVQAPQLASGWHSLGGQITAPPAVAAIPIIDGSKPVPPLFIATGTNKHLYIRSLTASWQLLGPETGSCIGGPAAVVTGTSTAGYTLTVACRGLDNALWANSTTLPASGLPRFTSRWTRLGGVLSAAPAAAPVGGTTTFFARGTNGEIYTRTLTTGYRAMPWHCIGQPSAALLAENGTTYFACQGTDHALWYASDSGTGWTSLASLGGSLIGGPAVVPDGYETIMLAEGTNHAVWQYALYGQSPGWHSLGGNVIGGVGAADLT